MDWGIYSYYYDNDKCDYQTHANLDDGQKAYRAANTSAKIFIAAGEV